MAARRGPSTRAGVGVGAGAAAFAAVWLSGLAACHGEVAPLLRRGPLGSLRDLVLFDRAEGSGGPFFLDRFEVTRGDFAEFAATATGDGADAARTAAAALLPGEAALPMAGVDLMLARQFARWRCCRLPRADEWSFACTGGGRDDYPWGAVPLAARANTRDLGVFQPLPVGMFESGRGGNGPYDLIGNVAEWTETVPGPWFFTEREQPVLELAARRLQRTPGLSVWQVPAGISSGALLVEAAGDDAPRLVLGSDFASPMVRAPEWRAPRERSSRIGIRLCTTPDELLRRLLQRRTEFDAEDHRQLERFARRGNHATVLRAARLRAGCTPEQSAWLDSWLP